MLNGRKNAIIGLSAIITLAFVELATIGAAIALFLEFIVGVDLPIFSTRD
jgi:hypothetical protein